MVVLYLLVMASMHLTCCKPGSNYNLTKDISLQQMPGQCCWHAVARTHIMLVGCRTTSGACHESYTSSNLLLTS